MLTRIVFFIQFLFVLGMSLLCGVFLCYILSLFIDFTFRLHMGDSAGIVFIFGLPVFVIYCLMKFVQNNTWE